MAASSKEMKRPFYKKEKEEEKPEMDRKVRGPPKKFQFKEQSFILSAQLLPGTTPEYLSAYWILHPEVRLRPCACT